MVEEYWEKKRAVVDGVHTVVALLELDVATVVGNGQNCCEEIVVVVYACKKDEILVVGKRNETVYYHCEKKDEIAVVGKRTVYYHCEKEK